VNNRKAGTLVNLGKQHHSVSRLAVRTIDFKLAYRLMNELKSRKLRFLLLEHDAVLPDRDMIWFGSEVEAAKFRDEGRAIAVSIENIKEAVDKAVRLLKGITQVHRLCFGIDPGPRPGIAWLADGAVLGVSQLEHIEHVAGHISAIAASLEYKQMIVRIGDGAPIIRDRIINDCLTHSIELEQVNESKTSRGLLRHNHVVSAIRIALLSGQRVLEFRTVQPTEGELREIQRQSRKFSNGRKTISTEMAYDVATGKCSLEQAVNEDYSSS
jgi:hypothetical protein